MSDRRAEFWLPILLAVIVTAGAAIGLDAYNRRTLPIFAQRAHPILHLAASRLHPEIPNEIESMVPDNHPPALTAAVAGARWFGERYRGFMAGQILWFVLLTAAAGLAGGRIGGARTAAFAACAAALTPAAHFAALALDDHVFNQFLTVLAAGLVITPAARRAWWPVAAAGVLAGLAVRYAFIGSNGLLVVTAVGAALAGGAAQDVFAARADQPGGIGRRWLFAAGSIALFFLAAWPAALRDGSLGYLRAAYYTQEVANAPFHGAGPWLTACVTYPFLMIGFHWGPPLTLAAVAGYARLFRTRAPSRWALAGWLGIPLALLTLISKKHQWYILYAVMAVGPVAGWYWSTLWERRRNRIWVGLWIAAATAWAGVGMARSTPTWMQAAFMDVVLDERGVPNLAPLPPTADVDDEVDAIVATLRSRRAPDEPLALIALDWVGPLEALRYRLLTNGDPVRLYVIGVSEIPPPEAPRPFFLYPRRYGEENPPPMPELLARTIAYVEGRIADGAENAGRLAFLYAQRDDDRPWDAIHSGRDFVVFDRATGP